MTHNMPAVHRSRCFRKFKIGLIGPKEVGKTALGNLLNGYLKDIGEHCDLVHETARNCPTLLNQKATLGTAFWIFGSQIAAEALVWENRRIVICDRTVIDLTSTLGDIKKKGDPQSKRQLICLKKMIIDYIRGHPYDFLFYVPIDPKYRFPRKPSKPEKQQAEDVHLRSLLKELKLRYIELSELSAQSRVQEIMRYLRGAKLLAQR